MSQDQRERHPRDLAVKVVDDVHPVRQLDVPEARRNEELEAHDREPGKADRHRELAPEAPPCGGRADEQHEERGADEEEIDADPEGALQSSLHGYSGRGTVAFMLHANRPLRNLR